MRLPVSIGSEAIETKMWDDNEITKEELRNALLNLVQENCCWGKRAAVNMEVSGITSVNSFHCQWITYMESREVSYRIRPYDYGAVAVIPYTSWID